MVEYIDVRMLINAIKSVGGRVVKVFMVVDKGDAVMEGDEIGNEWVPNLSSDKGGNNPICTFMTPSVPQFHSVAEKC